MTPRRALLDGDLIVRNLTTVFVNAELEGRGVHAGDFVWRGRDFRIDGTLTGITNVGTHRQPAFDPPAQSCGERAVMEGRFCGQVAAGILD